MTTTPAPAPDSFCRLANVDFFWLDHGEYRYLIHKNDQANPVWSVELWSTTKNRFGCVRPGHRLFIAGWADLEDCQKWVCAHIHAEGGIGSEERRRRATAAVLDEAAAA